ncbi:MAG: lyase family protein [Thermomicrobiales bacterium]|nr:lyase family protein [Thermomicrobiales bacterium]
MSQNPLAGIKKRIPQPRREFPDAEYARDVLVPEAERAEAMLGDAVIDIYRSHILQLAEQRVIEPGEAGRALSAIDALPAPGNERLDYALNRIDERILATSQELQLGHSAEERVVAATRMILRREILAVGDALLALRKAMIDLAGQHSTTLILATANGQVVQPTSLGHYLAAQIGPIARASARVTEAYPRVNRSPLGAVSGMSTAMPIRRARVAERLGFDGTIDNTFDAIAATDDLTEIVAAIGGLAVEVGRMMNDLAYWSRDDVGLIVPGDEYIHHARIQPQRRDPLVLEHLRLAFLAQVAAPQSIATMLSGRQMLGSMTSRLTVFFEVVDVLAEARAAYQLLTRVMTTLAVHRSMVAHRSHRGFSTSSELADLLAIDFRFPADQARKLAERVVIEWSEEGGEATTLTSEFIDSIALREIGREVGIEQEMLAKCLSPKRFVERRAEQGGPAPAAVTSQLDRATFALNHDRGWVREQRQQIDDAIERLHERCREIIADPAGALRRGASEAVAAGSDDTIPDIQATSLPH